MAGLTLGLFLNEEIMNKLSKENATLEFKKIVECFSFYVPEEAKTQNLETEIGGMTVRLQQEVEMAASFIQKIQEGKIEFSEKEEKIIYNFKKPIDLGEGGKVTQLKFGELTIGQLSSVGEKGICVRECNVASMTTEQRISVLKAMTGTSEDKLFNKLSFPVFGDLWMLAGYFFS